MNVPLSQLYNFLYQFSNEPALCFYRFYPHGSKRIEDLTKLVDHNKIVSPRYANFILCHDQEPLHWDLYSTRPGCQINLREVLGMHGAKYNPVLLLHSEQNSPELERYKSNRFIGVYYWSHAIIASDWFRFAKVDPALEHAKIIKHDFLIYNRAWQGTREYRLKFVELLVNNDLVEKCNVKFNPVDDGTSYVDHVFKNPEFQIQRFDFENILELNTIDSTASADYNSNDYTSTSIEVVLETLFDDSRWHLTEKSLRPIACGQPFMLVATAGSLDYLRSYGFRTFDGLIDESYDVIKDPVERLDAVIAEMKRIATLTVVQKEKLYTELNTIAKFNKQRFFSEEFKKQVLDEYKDNLEQGLIIKANFNAKTNTN